MQSDIIFRNLIYWGVWVIIPFIWEIGSGFFAGIYIVFQQFAKKKYKLEFEPSVSILVPVYNSSKTLKYCLDSLYNQNYSKKAIEVILIDNGSKDNSYDIYTEFQGSHSDFRMWWYSSEQGKSKALNKGIFSSTGKYVINIDSDGHLEKNAIRRVVEKFENEPDISCMTGSVLVDPKMIEETNGTVLRILREFELFEYMESFLVGRKFQSLSNNLYTVAGAFSCFRRETLMKTQLYNSETLGEDAHMTFQIKKFVGGRLVLCDDAFLYVDPIENLDKLYTQRQRWQRAQLEVASLFPNLHIGNIIDFFRNPTMRSVISDHTLLFPRLIWIFAMIYLYFINYPLEILLAANGLLYLLYVLNSFLYFFVAKIALRDLKPLSKHISANWYACLFIPLYRMLVYWIRISGVINSLTTDSKWKTKTLSEEFGIIKVIARGIVNKVFPLLRYLNKLVNK